jgi:hypothetical protein
MPLGLEALIGRCLAKVPADRFAGAAVPWSEADAQAWWDRCVPSEP